MQSAYVLLVVSRVSLCGVLLPFACPGARGMRACGPGPRSGGSSVCLCCVVIWAGLVPRDLIGMSSCSNVPRLDRAVGLPATLRCMFCMHAFTAPSDELLSCSNETVVRVKMSVENFSHRQPIASLVSSGKINSSLRWNLKPLLLELRNDRRALAISHATGAYSFQRDGPGSRRSSGCRSCHTGPYPFPLFDPSRRTSKGRLATVSD